MGDTVAQQLSVLQEICKLAVLEVALLGSSSRQPCNALQLLKLSNRHIP